MAGNEKRADLHGTGRLVEFASAGAGPRPDDRPADAIGRVVSVSGATAVILLEGKGGRPVSPEIGSVVAIRSRRSSIIASVSALSVPAPVVSAEREDEIWIAEVELVGEYFESADKGRGKFSRGVSNYPALGDPAAIANESELRFAFGLTQPSNIPVGKLRQNSAVPAVLRLGEFISRHAAILGSTGSGKSCATALILNTIIERLPESHFVVLDPHNEYSESFGDRASVKNASDLLFPYWLLTFDELSAIVFGDEGAVDREADLLADYVTAAKRSFASGADVRRAGGPTADTPVPYIMSDVIGAVDAALGKLDNRSNLAPYKRLKARIEAVAQDPRYGFMFGSLSVRDNLSEILSELLRVPARGKPVSVLELSGLPSIAVDVIVAAIARLAFEFGVWSEGRAPVTLVCEEAHRYAPADAGRGFPPARRNLARIAKEGRKYGVSLIIVSQRPSEIDQTVLSQCNTLVAMRVVNEIDQAVLRSAAPEASVAMLDMLSALSVGEAVVLGEGVQIPTRMRFDPLSKEKLPGAARVGVRAAWTGAAPDDLVAAAVAAWRASAKG